MRPPTFILEGIVTTRGADGSPHWAPMGPEWREEPPTLVLKPFQSSTTFENLRRHPQGVFHIVDDVELLVRAAIGQREPPPKLESITSISGECLVDACRWFAFEVAEFDVSAPRARLPCRILETRSQRDFVGLNRAQGAVVELCVMATRVTLLPLQEIAAEIRRTRRIVEKTGGPREHAALRTLVAYLANQGIDAP